MIHAPGSWSCPVRSPMNLELHSFDILTTQDLTHQHSDRLLVENGKLVFVTVLLSHVDLPLIALLFSSREVYLSRAKNTSVIWTMRSYGRIEEVELLQCSHARGELATSGGLDTPGFYRRESSSLERTAQTMRGSNSDIRGLSRCQT